MVYVYLALTGIDLLELINDKISKLDQALRSVDAPSDFNKNQALVTAEKLRTAAIQNGKIFMYDWFVFQLIFFVRSRTIKTASTTICWSISY